MSSYSPAVLRCAGRLFRSRGGGGFVQVLWWGTEILVVQCMIPQFRFCWWCGQVDAKFCQVHAHGTSEFPCTQLWLRLRLWFGLFLGGVWHVDKIDSNGPPGGLRVEANSTQGKGNKGRSAYSKKLGVGVDLKTRQGTTIARKRRNLKNCFGLLFCPPIFENLCCSGDPFLSLSTNLRCSSSSNRNWSPIVVLTTITAM